MKYLKMTKNKREEIVASLVVGAMLLIGAAMYQLDKGLLWN